MSLIAKTRIPVTVLTGYLGSGKIILLKRILTHKGKNFGTVWPSPQKSRDMG